MTSKREERRDALRRKLIDIAEKRIVAGGVSAIKARDLAKAAECALGAIYNVFDDLTDITIEVNGRSFRLLGQAVEAELVQHEGDNATQQMIVIANAYLDFALSHTNRWRSLFDLPFSESLDVPDWYWTEMDALFAHIAGPVQRCFPNLSQEDQRLMTRALFSSVHGIVSFGIENRANPVPRTEMARMIELIITQSTGNK